MKLSERKQDNPRQAAEGKRPKLGLKYGGETSTRPLPGIEGKR